MDTELLEMLVHEVSFKVEGAPSSAYGPSQSVVVGPFDAKVEHSRKVATNRMGERVTISGTVWIAGTANVSSVMTEDTALIVLPDGSERRVIEWNPNYDEDGSVHHHEVGFA